ncbi:MAG: tryptophan--tRNA ligase [Chitinophagales bacterium]|nr:tryptophan--tRNA ligase [Chitinophagales bacterium]MDW8394049.1 tryptophan--tRNA ligase [Chitinophagales bacterium]
MEIVVSGIRPTGRLHLGNYFGAVANFVRLQEQYRCYFFIADYHSLTTHPHPADLHGTVRQVLAEYLACGVDPKRCVLYRQSDVPETAELYLFLNMLAYVGELERSASFKEKVRSQPDNVNAGLLTYPVLMTADIIIHRAHKVPVGKDQTQHLEMARNFAERFNRLYGEDFFPLPQALGTGGTLVKVPGLDGSGKMGKSEGEGNAVFLSDTEEEIRRKVMRAVTDSGPTTPNQPMSEPVQNLFALMKLVSPPETVSHYEEAYRACTIRYGDMKKQLAADMAAFTAPIRERIAYYLNNDSLLRDILEQGQEQARASASATVAEVRRLIGFRKF